MYSTNLIDGAGPRSYLYPYLRTRTDMRRRIPSILGAPDMIVVNLTNDKIWVREDVEEKGDEGTKVGGVPKSFSN